MSLTVLRIIPTIPAMCLDIIDQAIAKSFLAKLHKDVQIEYIITDTLKLAEHGGNFESVSCNLCGDNMMIEDGKMQWIAPILH
jgi:hypothetical protein